LSRPSRASKKVNELNGALPLTSPSCPDAVTALLQMMVDARRI
jgi:hypothetical protein